MDKKIELLNKRLNDCRKEVIEIHLQINEIQKTCDHSISKIQFDSRFFNFECNKCGKIKSIDHNLSESELLDTKAIRAKWMKFDWKEILK